VIVGSRMEMVKDRKEIVKKVKLQKASSAGDRAW
jgi:hypothetical protein